MATSVLVASLWAPVPVGGESVGLVRGHDQRLQLAHLRQRCTQLLSSDAVPQAAVRHHQTLQKRQKFTLETVWKMES